jgi:uncharacterized damage-inducible protein DinB
MPSNGNRLLEQQIELWRKAIKPSLDRALELAPEDNLNWAPAENMMTLGNIFLHISECSDWWFDEVLNGKHSRELVPSWTSPAPPKPKIAEYMKIHWERLERMFACEPEVFARTYQFTGREKTRTVEGYWIFTHLLEHDIHHRSQINQYLRLLGIQPPDV